MADSCCMVGCSSLGTKSCEACGAVSYCSVECQKGNWKVHKHSCVNMNKMPTSFLSLSEIHKYVKKIDAQRDILRSQGKDEKIITLLQRFLAFVEHQYGVQVKGKSCWRRSDGDVVDDMILIIIRIDIAEMYHSVSCYDSALALAHAIAARQMLEHRDRSDDKTVSYLAKAEQLIASLPFSKSQHDVAEHHCEQSLMFARLIKGEGRITIEYGALDIFSAIRQGPCQYPEATELFEQAYIFLFGAYGPVHRDAQMAASQLIRRLIEIGDYSRADDYRRMNYENLTDTRNDIDHQDEVVSDTMMLLSNIWLRKPPVDDDCLCFGRRG